MVTALPAFTNESSTPVTTSTNLEPATDANPTAPTQSPLKNLDIASPDTSINSKKLTKLLIKYFSIAAEKSCIAPSGSVKRLLKYPITVPTFAFKKLNKSLNAMVRVSIVILKKSITFWLLANTSLNFSNEANKRPIPIALRVLPTLTNTLFVFLAAVPIVSNPLAVFLFPSDTWLWRPFISFFKSSISLIALSVFAINSTVYFCAIVPLF